MPRHKEEKFVFDDGESEDREDTVANRDSENEDEDDDEANADLSLKILEKAISRRGVGNKLDSDLSDSGVVSTVMVNGRNPKVKNSESNKKMKRKKLEADHEIVPIVWKDQDEEKVVEDVVKGEEEDDDDDVEKSTEPKTGEASSSNLVLRKLLRGARYFDPPDTLTCSSCGEQGHINFNCPTPTTRKKPCFICGSLKHGAKQCSMGQDCYICKKGGHRAKDCPNKYKSGSKGAVCLRCGESGHDMILCKYEYSQEDLKDIQCYVCKSFGHLCCVEPGNSPSWAVSCYRCGQLGHTGLACGRHYDESNENDSVTPSCFKCGEEGHFKRDCPNSSSVSIPENRKEASACFKCKEEGHFSRECPNSSTITTSQSKDSPSLCYKCKGAGHFARECPNHSQVSKRDRDTSSTPHKSCKKKKENSEHSSTPHESNGKAKKKKKKTHKEEPPQTTPQKPKQPQSTPRKPKRRGGWMTEEPEEESFQRGKMKRPRSPITPAYSHKLPTTNMSHNHRSPRLNSGGHFPDPQSSIPYGRNHRSPPFESSRHLSALSHRHQPYYSPPHHHQPHYPPSHHHHPDYPPSHHHQPHYPPSHHHEPHYPHHHHQQQHHQNYRYDEPAPSRYGRAHHYEEYTGNHERW